MLTPIQVARFWGKVQVGDRFVCWEWQGARKEFGYGICELANELVAHRVAYRLIHGDIPDGLLVRHKCDNPPCCNPYHLETGTKADNALDRKNRGRNGDNSGPLNPHAKLTAEAVAYIRENPDKLLQRELGAKFGVSQSVISRALLRKSWR